MRFWFRVINLLDSLMDFLPDFFGWDINWCSLDHLDEVLILSNHLLVSVMDFLLAFFGWGFKLILFWSPWWGSDFEQSPFSFGDGFLISFLWSGFYNYLAAPSSFFSPLTDYRSQFRFGVFNYQPPLIVSFHHLLTIVPSFGLGSSTINRPQ